MTVERQQSYEGKDGPERGPDFEIAQLLNRLAEHSEKVGIELDETDFVRIGPDEAMKLHGRLEIVLAALAVAAGLAVAHEASRALFEFDPEQFDAMRLMTRLGVATAGAGGAAVMFRGLKRLETGYKRLRGFISLKELGGVKH
jgi:hypothetical protein